MNNGINHLRIEGLFGYQTFDSNFDSDTAIFIGENGMGKTTVMSILFYLLKADLLELLHYDFEEVYISYTDGTSFSLRHSEIEEYVEKKQSGSHMRGTLRRTENLIKDNVPAQLLKEALGEYEKALEQDDKDIMYLFDHIYNYPKLEKAYRTMENHRSHMPQRWFFRGMKSLLSKSRKEKSIIEAFLEDTEERFGETNIIYFPTYRRIEEDFNALFSHNSDEDFKGEELELYNVNSLISRHHMNKHKELLQFGMGDVEKIFSEILESIRVKSIENFNELNGVLLSQYLNGNVNNRIDFSEMELRISLDRIGNKISSEQKERIISELFLKANDINTQKTYLVNYVVNLVKSYKKTQPIDEKIKVFIKIVNHYLFQKVFEYDASTLRISLMNTMSKSEMELDSLSSGEVNPQGWTESPTLGVLLWLSLI